MDFSNVVGYWNCSGPALLHEWRGLCWCCYDLPCWRRREGGCCSSGRRRLDRDARRVVAYTGRLRSGRLRSGRLRSRWRHTGRRVQTAVRLAWTSQCGWRTPLTGRLPAAHPADTITLKYRISIIIILYTWWDISRPLIYTPGIHTWFLVSYPRTHGELVVQCPRTQAHITDWPRLELTTINFDWEPDSIPLCHSATLSSATQDYQCDHGN